MPEGFTGTERQNSIMREVLAAADAGALLTTDDIIEKLGFRSRGAAVSAIQVLTKHGFLVKNHLGGSRSMELRPTVKAYMHFRGGFPVR
jgi:hypothetical protein